MSFISFLIFISVFFFLSRIGPGARPGDVSLDPNQIRLDVETALRLVEERELIHI